jgi:hypothetical protein
VRDRQAESVATAGDQGAGAGQVQVHPLSPRAA